MFGNMLGHCLFQELGTHSSKIGKHWYEPLGASSSLNWEPVVPRLQQFPDLGTRCSKIARIVLSYRFGLNGPDGPNGLQRAPTGLLHGRRAQRAQRARRARRAREAVALNEPIIPSGAGVTLYIQLGRSTTVLGI